MKILLIESKLKNPDDFKISDKEIKKLPNPIFLAYSIQYKELAEKIRSILRSKKIKVSGFTQVLGCSVVKTKYPILLIGQGRFHAINLYLQSPSIFIFENNNIVEIPKQEIELIKQKRQSSYIKFLKANKIGIIVSTKPGQENLNSAINIKEKLSKKGKIAYIFLSNNIDVNQFENFKIDSWVNTACKGLAYDNPSIINLDELDKL